MPYRCPAHDLVLLCSHCLLRAMQADERQTELVDPRGLLNVHVARVEIPCRHCGRELLCMACIDAALAQGIE